MPRSTRRRCEKIKNVYIDKIYTYTYSKYIQNRVDIINRNQRALCGTCSHFVFVNSDFFIDAAPYLWGCNLPNVIPRIKNV